MPASNREWCCLRFRRELGPAFRGCSEQESLLRSKPSGDRRVGGGSEVTSLRTARMMRRDIEDLLGDVSADFGGACSARKAHVLAWLIKHARMRASCDIGVYRGRSFLPQAWAHREFTGGVVYGIDPYSHVAAEQHDNLRLRGEFERWAAATDFDKLYEEVLQACRDHGLEQNAEMLRMTSRVVRSSSNGRFTSDWFTSTGTMTPKKWCTT